MISKDMMCRMKKRTNWEPARWLPFEELSKDIHFLVLLLLRSSISKVTVSVVLILSDLIQADISFE